MMFVVSTYAQDVKWGKVSSEELQMTSYAPDSNAQAVVLWEFGDVVVEYDGRITYKYHKRVKLLSEAAYDDWGTYTIPFISGKYGIKINKVQGQTFTLDENGKVVTHKLGKKDVYKESVTENLNQYKFTLPGLEPGAIVEYRYTMTADTPHRFPNWTFQHSEPTVWSKLQANIHEHWVYVRVAENVGQFTINTQEEAVSSTGNSTIFTWALNDVPALRDEPFITTLEDYRAGIQFQLSSIQIPGQGSQTVLGSWLELSNELIDDADFGAYQRLTRTIKDLAAEITEGITDPKEQMIALHAYVSSAITWDGIMSAWPTANNPDKILKAGTGRNSDQMVVLIALLRSMGMDADPALLSTRQHGAVIPLYPLVNQFNYMITHVNLNGTSYFLDCTDPHAPYNMLPVHALSSTAWLVKKNRPTWVNLNQAEKYRRVLMVEGTLDESGNLQGELQTSSGGYAALSVRTELSELEQNDAIMETMVDEVSGLELSSLQIKDLDSLAKPIDISASINMEGFAQQAGDFMYINPHALRQVEENPLRLEDRTFPVDLAYPRDIIYSLKLVLPEGYVVEETPPNMRLALPEKGGVFQRNTTVMNNGVFMQTRFMLNESKYEPAMYQGLREIYNRLVAAQAEQIVLKRSEEPNE